MNFPPAFVSTMITSSLVMISVVVIVLVVLLVKDIRNKKLW